MKTEIEDEFTEEQKLKPYGSPNKLIKAIFNINKILHCDFGFHINKPKKIIIPEETS